MLQVKTSAEAQAIIERHFGQAVIDRVEIVSLSQAMGQTLAQDMIAPAFVPDFNRSSVDGYAVYAEDTFGCSQTQPALLRLMGDVAMGQVPKRILQRGECLYVPTGAQLPSGANAMVMIEDTELLDDLICIEKPTAPGAHMIFRGDDVKAGDVLLQKNTVLGTKEIGSLAAIGKTKISVFARPRVGILSTGDELVPPDAQPVGAQVRDVNGPMLCAALQALGCMAQPYGILADDRQVLYEAVSRAAKECDVVLVSGGSSVGVKDATQSVIEALGRILFHGIAIKPGKPTILGNVENVPVFGLPGHPVAAYFIFELFVRPLLCRMQKKSWEQRTLVLQAASAIPSNHGREECVPVYIENGFAHPIMGKSGLITILCRADGYLRIPRNAEGVAQGEAVTVILF